MGGCGQGLGDVLNTELDLSQDLGGKDTESYSYLFSKQQPLYPPTFETQSLS